MPIRFPTEAANADFLAQDSEDPSSVGADGKPRGKAQGQREHFQRSDRSRDSAGSRGNEAKPGKDINQAGFIKDKDSGNP